MKESPLKCQGKGNWIPGGILFLLLCFSLLFRFFKRVVYITTLIRIKYINPFCKKNKMTCLVQKLPQWQSVGRKFLLPWCSSPVRHLSSILRGSCTHKAWGFRDNHLNVLNASSFILMCSRTLSIAWCAWIIYSHKRCCFFPTIHTSFKRSTHCYVSSSFSWLQRVLPTHIHSQTISPLNTLL